MKANSTEAPPAVEAEKNQPQKRKANSFESYFADNQRAIESLLPEHMSFRRFARMTIQAIYENPEIAKCEPNSIVFAISEAAKVGLEPDGQKAAFIPYGNRLQYQPMYQGILELCYRTGEYEIITAMPVYENDLFSYRYGLRADLEHIPADDPKGEPVKYYALYKLKNGGFDFKVMSRKAVEKHAKRYSKGYDRKGGAWQTDFDGMALKTVLLRTIKLAPKTAEIFRGETLVQKAELAEKPALEIAPPMKALPTVEQVRAEAEQNELEIF